MFLWYPAAEESPGAIRRISSSPNVRHRPKQNSFDEEELEKGAEYVESVFRSDKVKRRSRVKSWFGFTK